MFSSPTVFIVGAGASAECNLPVGAILKEQIAKALRFQFDFNRQIAGDEHLYDCLRRRYNNDHSHHTKAGRELSDVLETFVSIDEALHYFSARPDTVLLGKLTVAHLMLRAERASVLFDKKRQGRADLDQARATWLPHFLSMALGSLTREQVENAFDKVTIINFNYDRTIEHYLFWALQDKAALTAAKARSVVGNLKMIRPYGSLGALKWNHEKDGVAYGGDEYEGNNDLFSISDGIRTYTEQNIDGDIQKKIRSSISQANVIVFIGFGFHQQNMTQLSVSGSSINHVFATVNGIDAHNHHALRARIASCLSSSGQPQLIDARAHDLLERLRPSIMQAAS